MNVVHSVDAYILRSIHRRCNYDREMAEQAYVVIQDELIRRSLGGTLEPLWASEEKVEYYVNQYEHSTVADVVILPYINVLNVTGLSVDHLAALATIVNGMLEYQPFEVISIHDEYKTHPNNMNHLRQQYINVLAELAESNLLDDLLSQIHGKPGKFNKLTPDLGAKIRNSNYALS